MVKFSLIVNFTRLNFLISDPTSLAIKIVYFFSYKPVCIKHQTRFISKSFGGQGK
jgi:hypothetical protein